jgi:hypothetical protein
MTKYRVEVITKQRNNIIVNATDEETAIQGFIDLLYENPEGYRKGLFDTFKMKNIVCISDLQVPYHDVEATKAVAKFIQWYQPETVVSCGDEMDMQTIVSGVKGTELEFERSIGRDRDLTRQVLYDLTVEHMVRSNHTDRLFTTVAMRAPGLLGLPELQLENFLGLDELEINIILTHTN